MLTKKEFVLEEWIEWDGQVKVIGWTHARVDEFVRAFCPNFKKQLVLKLSDYTIYRG